MLINEKLSLNKQSRSYVDFDAIELILCATSDNKNNEKINKVLENIKLWITKHNWNGFQIYMWKSHFGQNKLDQSLIDDGHVSINEQELRKIYDKYGDKTKEEVYSSGEYILHGCKDALIFLNWDREHTYQLWIIKR